MALNFESHDETFKLTISVFDLDNIRDILAEPTRYGWFGAHVLRLCQKADHENLRKIATVFPEHAAAFLIFWTGHVPEAYRDVIPRWEFYTKMMYPRIHKER